MNCRTNSRTSRCRVVSGGSIVHLLVVLIYHTDVWSVKWITEKSSMGQPVKKSIGNGGSDEVPNVSCGVNGAPRAVSHDLRPPGNGRGEEARCGRRGVKCRVPG